MNRETIFKNGLCVSYNSRKELDDLLNVFEKLMNENKTNPKILNRNAYHWYEGFTCVLSYNFQGKTGVQYSKVDWYIKHNATIITYIAFMDAISGKNTYNEIYIQLDEIIESIKQLENKIK
jgi:hypothetical protein